MSYPKTLADELSSRGKRPTGNIEWDRAVLHVMRQNDSRKLAPWLTLDTAVSQATSEIARTHVKFPDLSDDNAYRAHADMILFIANEIVLGPQRRRFTIDDDNREVIRFLLYYFNECPLAEEVFPGRGYKLHKNILLQGGVGVGKTMLMQIFSEYLRRTGNPRAFANVSVTQMVNYYSIHNNIDRFLYNEEGSKTFQGNPVNLCLNDIGVDNRPFYGIDTLTIVQDFLHARNEIWANASEYNRRFAHLTTNLTNDQLKKKFSAKDDYGRIIDRFKTYNVIPLPGSSRR